MAHEQIPLDSFEQNFAGTTELSSVAIGGEILAVSDEFFAEAFHLLLVEPAPSLKGQFGPKGALYSGWETRRHNPAHDWCIIRLGTSGTLVGFDIDTTHFNGNEAPEASVEVLHGSPTESPDVSDPRWTELLPKVALGPTSRHLFKVPESSAVNFVKLNMYPDGGIARFRVYGQVVAVSPEKESQPYDMAHVFAGGRVPFISDQHFGVGSNIINPGRGKDMGDGWETKRSRQKGHKDWAIIQLGAAGYLEHVEIDTAHFMGNFPESCEVHALAVEERPNWEETRGLSEDWQLILHRTKLGPHRQHYFQLENVDGKMYTHVRVTIYPDGGLKRVRVIGRKALEGMPSQAADDPETTNEIAVISATKAVAGKIVPVLPLTPEAFAGFGQVIQAYQDHNGAPKGTKITPANAGSASKFHKLSLLTSSYSTDSKATPGLSVYRCQPLQGIAQDKTTDLKMLERHAFTNQAFIPMGGGEGEGIAQPGTSYLVVVAQNGEEDKPDLKTLRAFLASSAQGIVYDTGIWHQPMTVLYQPMDFTCVETQIGDGSIADCEIVELDQSLKLQLP